MALDDGSNDNSTDILENMKEIRPFPMKVIRQSNSGNIAANYNKLMNLANGEFISVLACDDKLIPKILGCDITEMSNNDKIGFICHSKVKEINENGKEYQNPDPLKLSTIDTPTIDDMINLEWETFNAYYMQGSIYRTDIIKQIGGFDEDMICDDIVFRTKYAKYIKQHPQLSFKVLHNEAVYYRRHSSNISTNIVRQIEGITQYLDRYWGKSPNPKQFFRWYKFGASQGALSLLAPTVKYGRLRKYLPILLYFLAKQTLKKLFSHK